MVRWGHFVPNYPQDLVELVANLQAGKVSSREKKSVSQVNLRFGSLAIQFGPAFLLGAASLQLINQLPLFQLSWSEHLVISSWGIAIPSLPPRALKVFGLSLLGGGAIFIGGFALFKKCKMGSVGPPLRSVRDAPRANALGHQAQILFDKTHADLELHTQALVSLIGSYLNRSSDHSKAVANVGLQLDAATNLGQVHALIETLIIRNSQAERDAEQLRGRLEGAQAQINAMRKRLGTAEEQAALDPLTGVANRRELEKLLDRQITMAHSTETPLCLVMVDIDNFKSVNDAHGHQMGDNVLKSFARVLSQRVRSTDVVARYGGEEFAIVFSNMHPGNAFQTVERMRLAFESACLIDVDNGKPLVWVTASFGIAELREHELQSELIKRADQMLYEAKRNGRNRVLIMGATARATRSIASS